MTTTTTTRATTRLNQSGASSARATTLFRCISLSTLGCENLIFQNQKMGVGPSQDSYARKYTRKQWKQTHTRGRGGANTECEAAAGCGWGEMSSTLAFLTNFLSK